jgi:fibronectin-binding autotransporter adhesin
MRFRLAIRVVAILLVLLTVGESRPLAQTAVSWTGSSGGDWNTASDWSGGVVPNNGSGKTYNVTVAPSTGQTVSLNLGVTISDLTLGSPSGSNVTLQSVASDSLSIANGGSLTVESTGTLLFDTTGSDITVGTGGTLTNNGTLDLEAAGETLKVTGTTTNASGATISIEGGSAATFTGNVTNSGTFETGFSGGSNTVTVTGTFTNNAGATLELEGSGDAMSVNALSNSGTLTLDSGTTLTITGGGNGVTDVAAGTTYNIGGTFNVKNGSTTTNALAKLNSVEGTLTLQNGQTNTITPTSGTLTIASSGSVELSYLSVTDTTLSITGNVNNSGELTTGFTGGTNTVNVSGTLTNNVGGQVILYSSTDNINVNVLSNSGTLDIGDSAGSGATLTITGGGQGVTDVVAGSTINLFGNFNVVNSGKTTGALGSLTSVEGTLTIENGQTTSLTPNGGTLTIASSGSLELSDMAGTTTGLTVTGSVNNSGSFTTGFSGGTNTVNVSGTFTNDAGANMILYSSTDVVNVNALSNSGNLQIGDTVGSEATVNITGGGQGVTDVVAGATISLYGNFNVVNGGKSTSALANLTTIAGNLYLMDDQSTSVTPGGGTLTIASTGTLALSEHAATTTTLSIAGNVNNSGAFTTGFSGGTNTVTVTGTFTNNSGGTLELYAGNGSGGTDLVSIGTLSNSGNVTLLYPGATLDITGTGTLTNNGSFDLEQGTLKFNASSATITGTGTLTLGNSGATGTGVIDVGSSDTGTLTLSSGTITGNGNIGNGTLTLVNKGTINANGEITSGTLTVQPGSGAMTNSGTLEATNQGTLILEGTYNNSGGTIAALGAGGGTVSPTVQLTAGTVIDGGTLTTTTVDSNSGLIEGTGAVTLNGITNTGTYAVEAGTTTTLEGTDTNSGSITLTGSTLSIGNSVTLSGKGTVVLSNSSSNLITGATSGLKLTTANTIEGSGTISNLGIVNTGTIEATQSTALIILPSSSGLNNEGTLSVSAGDTMQIGTSAGGALLNFSGTTLTGGTYTVDGTLKFGASGTSVVTDAATITLTGAGAKILDFAAQNVLTDLATITTAGSFTISSGANFTTAGNFTNDGKLTANTGSTFTVTGTLSNFNSTTDTLTAGTYTVGGKLEFAGADIVKDAANITLEGTGEIENSTSSTNGLANLNTITAAGSFTLATKANFTTVGNLTNNGKLTVNTASTLTVTGDLTNFNSSTETLSSGTYTVGGTLEFSGANIVTNAANLTVSGSTAKILNGTTNGLANFANNTGSFTLTGNANLTTGSSAFTNSDSLTVTKGSDLTVGGGNAYSQSAGTTTVDGTLSASSGVNITGGTILGAGTLSGSVTVGGSGTTPTISAGDSGKAGLLVITGNYTQLATATMNSFIGGATVGTQFSQLQADGTATLAGTLTVTLASGFTPTVGSTFTVLTAGTVTGTYSNSEVAINSSEHFNVSYTSTGVVLTVATGAATEPAGAPKSNLVAALPTKQQPARSNLRQRASVTAQNGSHFLVASAGSARSGAAVEGYGVGRFELSNRLPVDVAARWEPVHSGAVAVAQALRSPARAGLSDLRGWSDPVGSRSSLRMPATGTLMRREPVKLLTPILPRLQR